MNHDPTVTNDRVQEELVAYLDGELAPDDTRRVEERLSRDTAYRQRLNQLQRAWDLLDQLPRSTANAAFTKTTVEMVAIAAADDVKTIALQRQRQLRWGWMFGGGGVLVAAILGYLTVSLWLAAPERKLLRDLPVIENLDFYKHADSIAFLEKLNDLQVIPEAELDDTAAPLFASVASLNERKKILRTVSSTTAAELRAKQERFERLSAEQRDHYQTLHQQLSAHPDAETLRRLLTNYNAWLASLPQGRPAELLAKPTDERLEIVRNLASVGARSEPRNLIDRPSPEDGRKIVRFLDGWIAEHETQIRESLPPIARERFAQIAEPTTRRLVMYAMATRLRRETSSDFPVPSREDIQKLLAELSPEAQQAISNAKSSVDEGRLLQAWVSMAVQMRTMGMVTVQELSRFYDQDLSPSDRTRLDNLPRDVFQRELRKLYFEQHVMRKLQPDRGVFPKPGPGANGEMPRGPFGGEGKNRPFKVERRDGEERRPPGE